MTSITACMAPPKLAPLLEKPALPTFSKEVIYLNYATAKPETKIKSVQLPSHPIKVNDAIRLKVETNEFDSELTQFLSDALSEKNLHVNGNNHNEYLLTIQQLSVEKLPNETLRFVRPVIFQPIHKQLAAQSPSYRCANYDVQVALKLTHIKSQDVVWIAKAGQQTIGFLNAPLGFKYEKHKKVINEQQVIDFIAAQNTMESRELRFNKEVNIPQYEYVDEISLPKQASGYCSDEQVKAHILPLKQHLITSLVNKLQIK